MIQSRHEREQLEQSTLAPYAAHSSRTRGRAHEESRHSRRVEFQRDRDRIVNSKCFRRLEYKTQVFVNGTADHYRTRLTHTIEMASVGRTLARALMANEDLTAAISLAHDIGHSPFGHAGERRLNDLMAAHGGFDHNVQSLRWVELLEETYPDFNGLNLTWEVRAGLRKHESKMPGLQLDDFPIGPWQYIEAQIADVADDITCQAHDTQDGLEAGLLSIDVLRTTKLWGLADARVRAQHPHCSEERFIPTVIRMLFTLQIEDVLKTARIRIAEWTPQSPQDVMTAPDRIVTFSSAMAEILHPYRAMLFREMYGHATVQHANDEAVDMMTELFQHYVNHPEHMGTKAQRRLPVYGLMRTACDYVAGCTDRYALEQCAAYKITKTSL
ncbi:MAG: deoxyguanosinetriphosphate triphosphohydrolase [Verrucomicrobia bacterium]|nr:deoxyguanosinetriphosphate triphosphohydrolase [Verrucomicrobiota bacterium]